MQSAGTQFQPRWNTRRPFTTRRERPLLRRPARPPGPSAISRHPEGRLDRIRAVHALGAHGVERLVAHAVRPPEFGMRARSRAAARPAAFGRLRFAMGHLALPAVDGEAHRRAGRAVHAHPAAQRGRLPVGIRAAAHPQVAQPRGAGRVQAHRAEDAQRAPAGARSPSRNPCALSGCGCDPSSPICGSSRPRRLDHHEQLVVRLLRDAGRSPA